MTRQSGFGRRTKKSARRQRVPEVPDAPDERASFLLRFLVKLLDNSPPNYPDGEPWYVKHFLWISIPITLVPAAIGLLVFGDLLLAVGSGFAAMGVFSMSFGVAPTFTSVIIHFITSGRRDILVESAARRMPRDLRYKIHHGARARLMGLSYVLIGLMFMPLIDGNAPFLVLLFAITPEGQ